MAPRWTTQEDERIRELIAEHAETNAIAAAIGRGSRVTRRRIGALFPGGTGRPVGIRPSTLAAKLEAGIKQRGPDDCWEWARYCNPGGYGRLSGEGRTVLAHRLAWSVAHGRDVPEGMLVRHTCDNPPCCNPAHLLLGDDAQNMSDKLERGRHPTGERSTNARLTEAGVREIRSRRAAGESLASIAAAFGVSVPTVSEIANRKKWRHLA